jgi:hypothetical protein
MYRQVILQLEPLGRKLYIFLKICDFFLKKPPKMIDRHKKERETGLEPATNSLEGCDSSQLSYSRGWQNIIYNVAIRKWKIFRFGVPFAIGASG